MSIDFSRVQAICFDVDGTLSDTDNLWVSKFKKVFSPIKPVVKEENLEKLGRWMVMTMESPGNLVYEVLDRLHFGYKIRLVNDLRQCFPACNNKF